MKTTTTTKTTTKTKRTAATPGRKPSGRDVILYTRIAKKDLTFLKKQAKTKHISLAVLVSSVVNAYKHGVLQATT